MKHLPSNERSVFAHKLIPIRQAVIDLRALFLVHKPNQVRRRHTLLQIFDLHIGKDNLIYPLVTRIL